MSEMDQRQREWLVSFFQEDGTDRLRAQQEFTVSGFKALVLINGGAVIALLTYLGNVDAGSAEVAFRWAFGGYILGLVLAVLAYLPAYYGQGQIMLHSASRAFDAMGVKKLDEELQTRREKRSVFWIGTATVLCLLSLASFVGGSIAAMCGIS